jgi:ABC-type bacteriocin/lantibiotic exporter with double-glycine peptidase domain
MNKIREFLDLALCMACIALPFVLYFAFVMKP